MKNICKILFSFFLWNVSFGQTNVGGFINANTTWTLAGSPYHVIGNTILSHGYTLTIDPGVVVKFDSAKALQIDGELNAVGTAANRIVFTSNKPSPARGDWGEIHFSDTSVDAIHDILGNYISGSIMKYCDILYGGGIGNGEVHIESSSPYFDHCNIGFSQTAGIYSNYSLYYLINSTVKNCNGFGLNFNSVFWNINQKLTVESDSIISNSSGGIELNGVSSFNSNNTIEIRNNHFISNGTNGALDYWITYATLLAIENNTFENNYAYRAIVFIKERVKVSIQCNKFINNINSQVSSGSTIYSWTEFTGNISYNLFKNNPFLLNFQTIIFKFFNEM